MSGLQHTEEDLAALTRIAEFDPTRLAALEVRGEHRIARRDGAAKDGRVLEAGKPYAVEPAGLKGAASDFEKLHRIYVRLGLKGKTLLWLASLLHDMAKPIHAPKHDEVMGELVRKGKIPLAAALSEEDRHLLARVIWYHTAIGVTSRGERNRIATLQELFDAAQSSGGRLFTDILLLLTIADVDSIGKAGMLTSSKIRFYLDMYDELTRALNSNRRPLDATPKDDEEWGRLRLQGWTAPFQDSLHSADAYEAEVEELYPSDVQRSQFYQRLGSIWRFTYNTELLKSLEDPKAVTRLMALLVDATGGLKLDRRRLHVNFDRSLNVLGSSASDTARLNGLIRDGVWDSATHRLQDSQGAITMTVGAGTLVVGYQVGLEQRELDLERVLTEGFARAEALGIAVDPEAKVGFDPEFQGSIGSNVRIEGPITVYFGPDGVWVQDGDEVGLFQDTLDVADGTVISAAGLEEQTKLTWKAWLATLGTWLNTKEALRKFDPADRTLLRGQINGFINRLVKRGYYSAAYYSLWDGIPALLVHGYYPYPPRTDFQENLPILSDHQTLPSSWLGEVCLTA